MKVYHLTFGVLIFILFSCKVEKDKTFKIYHLKPNKIHKNPERVTKNGWFDTTRNDFFVIKNYDSTNEQHKIKIDSFVVDYLKKDSFLSTNKNSNWKLTFFKYGEGIDEKTKHIDGTDYAIHDLFSFKKEVGSFYFNAKLGYVSTKYNIAEEKFIKEKREILSDYFKNYSATVLEEQIIDNPKNITGEYELIKGYTVFLDYKVESILSSNLIIEKLSNTDFGYYSAYKIKGRRPYEREGILRNYKNKYYELSICDYDSSKDISKENFTEGIKLHNQVIIKKKGEKLAMIKYGGNFRKYMLYKKIPVETNFSIYLEDALDRSKLDYQKFLTAYKKTKNYDKSKLEIEYVQTNTGWVTKHMHKEGSVSFENIHYYQNPFQEEIFVKQDAVFFELLK